MTDNSTCYKFTKSDIDSIIDMLEVIVNKLHSDNNKKLLNRQESATYFGISVSKFDNIRPQIQSVRIGNSTMFRKEDLDSFIESNLVSPTLTKTPRKSGFRDDQHTKTRVRKGKSATGAKLIR